MRRGLRHVLRRIDFLVEAKEAGSLETDPALTARIVDRAVAYPSQHFEDRNPLASPPFLETTVEERIAWRLAGVRLWPSLGAVTCGGRVLREMMPKRRFDAMMESDPVFWRFPVSRIEGCAATYLDTFSRMYFHWLVDALPRIYALHGPVAQKVSRIFLLRPRAGMRQPPFDQQADAIITALLPQNVVLMPMPVHRSIEVDEYVHMPRLTGDYRGPLPRDYLDFFRRRIFDTLAIKARPRRRIHISRRLAKRRHLTNEGRLLSALKPFGFESHCLEHYSLSEQIRLLADAEVVVGLHGAGMANVIFATECKIVEIHPSSPRYSLRWLCHSLDHHYSDVEAGAPMKGSDCSAPIDAVLDRLRHLGVRPRVATV